MKPDGLDEELMLLLDGSLPPERTRELMEIMLDDAEVRGRYYGHAAIHHALSFRFKPLAEGKGCEPGIQARKPFFRRTAFWAAAALVVLAAVVFQKSLPAPPVITKCSEGARYVVEYKGRNNSGSGELRDGANVRLEQGTMELRFREGAHAIFQAPARFVMVNRSLMRLERGSVYFHIDPEARNFVVETGMMKVVNTGAEFGMRAVNIPRNEEIHVIRGSLRVENRQENKEQIQLHAGEASAANSSGEFWPIKFDASAFPIEISKGLPNLRFTFDEADGPEIPVTGSLPKTNNVKAEYINASGKRAIPELVPGCVGRSIRFKGDGDHVRTNWRGLESDLPRSVSFWTKVEKGAPFTHLPAVANWGDPKSGVGKWKVLLAQETSSEPVVVRISLGSVAFEGRTAMNDGVWHHVAVVFSNRTEDVRTAELSNNYAIYVDGQREILSRRQFRPLLLNESENKPRTDTSSDNSRPLLIGLAVEPRLGSFSGLIDELTIHAGALSAEDVRQLHAAGKP